MMVEWLRKLNKVALAAHHVRRQASGPWVPCPRCGELYQAWSTRSEEGLCPTCRLNQALGELTRMTGGWNCSTCNARQNGSEFCGVTSSNCIASGYIGWEPEILAHTKEDLEVLGKLTNREMGIFTMAYGLGQLKGATKDIEVKMAAYWEGKQYERKRRPKRR